MAESLINFRGSLLAQLVEDGHEVIACAPDADLKTKNRLCSLGVKYFDVPISRTGLNPCKDFLSLYKIFRILKKIKPDIFLGYTAKPVIYGSLAARLAGVKCIYSMITGLGYAFVSSSWKSKFVGLIIEFLYRISLRTNTKIFFQNPDDCQLFQTKGILSHKSVPVIIDGSGVDLKFFNSVPLPEKTSFLLIARLLKDKGIREYVQAAEIIKKKYPDISFKLVGWLDENPSCISQRELSGWINQGTIEYLGKLTDVRPAIASSSVYVLPSYREGMPRTVLEAMSMGRPIITTDVPGCRQSLIDGENGFLVPVRNVIALANAMEKFIISPEIVSQMGSRSLEIAIQRFDVSKVNKCIIQAMEL